MNFYTRVDSEHIKSSTAPELVLGFLAPQEALLKPLLVNASAGGTEETQTPLWLLCSLVGDVWHFFLKGQTHLSLLFCVSKGESEGGGGKEWKGSRKTWLSFRNLNTVGSSVQKASCCVVVSCDSDFLVCDCKGHTPADWKEFLKGLCELFYSAVCLIVHIFWICLEAEGHLGCSGKTACRAGDPYGT